MTLVSSWTCHELSSPHQRKNSIVKLAAMRGIEVIHRFWSRCAVYDVSAESCRVLARRLAAGRAVPVRASGVRIVAGWSPTPPHPFSEHFKELVALCTTRAAPCCVGRSFFLSHTDEST